MLACIHRISLILLNHILRMIQMVTISRKEEIPAHTVLHSWLNFILSMKSGKQSRLYLPILISPDVIKQKAKGIVEMNGSETHTGENEKSFDKELKKIS